MKDSNYVAGASSSLNQSITELLDYINEPGARNRGNLRASLNEMIADLAVEWTEYGFYLGHREAYRNQRDAGEIPATLNYAENGWEVTPDCLRDLNLESRIRRT